MIGKQSLQIRVQRSLERIGYGDIQVAHLGDGRVRLIGTFFSPADGVMAIDVVQTVIGVRTVSIGDLDGCEAIVASEEIGRSKVTALTRN